MFLREAPTQTLGELREEVGGASYEAIDTQNSNIRFDLIEGGQIVIEDRIAIPATLTGLQAFGDWVQVPGKFIQRIPDDLRQHILTYMFTQNPGLVRVIYDEDGVQMVVDPETRLIEPSQLVDVAIKVMGPESLVLEHWITKDEYRLDTVVPETFHRGVGGDRQVGDITCGGLRFGQDRKHNLAPWVSELMYRLECTNGIEREDPVLKIDARGQTVESVLVELENMASLAFSRVNNSIESFYEMREQRLENPEREIIRLAQERGLSDRTTFHLSTFAPEVESMFDLVNLFSNQANDPKIRTKSAQRRNLEKAAGSLVREHASRCTRCRAKLN